jgi:capsid protein
MRQFLHRAIDWTAEKLWGASNGGGYWHSTSPLRKVLENWKPKRGSINAALGTDLPTLAAQGKMLDRATPVYRGAVEGRKAELVGTGIGIEPMTSDPGLNKVLRDLWDEQANELGVLGESLWELQRMASGEIDAAGSILWRGLVLPERIDDGLIPWCVLAIPRDWFSDMPVATVPNGHQFVAGVETDSLGRARFAHLKNPDDPMAPGERVALGGDARLIFERRWALQATGAPRLDTLVERILQDDEIVTNEMKAARVAGALAVIIADDELRQAYLDGKLPADFMDIDGGSISFIGANSKATSFTHDRPSPNTKNWRETVRGDIAAGASISRVWTDRDGSSYNFANSRFDQIRTQMVVKPAQDWFGKGVASWPYLQALPYLMVLAGKPWPADKLGQRRLQRHRIVPDIPPELDAKSAADAFEKANQNGIDSRTDYLGRTGKDPALIAAQIDAESRDDAAKAASRIAAAQKLCDELNAKTPSLKLHWSHIVTLPGAKTAPGAYLQAAAPAQAQPQAPAEPKPAEPDPEDDSEALDETMRHGFRDLSARLDGLRQPAPQPQTIIVQRDAPTVIPAPIVNVAPSSVRVDVPPAQVTVQQAPAEVTVHAHNTVRAADQPAPVVNVTVPTPVVNVDNQVVVPARTVRATQQSDGSVLMTPQE